MQPDARETHFDEQTFSTFYPPGVENNFWNLARNCMIVRELAAAADSGLIRPGENILEVGCGTGVVVKYLRERDWPVFGVELGMPRVLPGLEQAVWTGRAAAQLDDTFRRTVSCILLFDVIEHIEDDVSFIGDLLRAYPTCRSMIVSVPARMEAWSNFDEFSGHFRRYDRRALSAHLNDAGCSTVRLHYFFHSLYFAAVLINLFRIRRNVSISATRHPNVDRVVAGLLDLENRVLPGWFPGLSLMATAVRR